MMITVMMMSIRTVYSFSITTPSSSSSSSTTTSCCMRMNQNDRHNDCLYDDIDNDNENRFNRRSLLRTLPMIMIPIITATSSTIANAATSKDVSYNDDQYKFSVSNIPSSWVMNEQTLSDRRRIIFYNHPEDPSTGLFIAYTPIRDDFTSIYSMGNVDQVGQQTILPKSGMMADENNIITAKMLNAYESKQTYYFDYIQGVEPNVQPLTHFRTIFTLLSLNDAAVARNMLVTVTLQTKEAEYASSYEKIFDSIINSFTKTTSK